MSDINVVLTIGLAEELVNRIRELDPRLNVTVLSSAQRQAYRGGHPIWFGYDERQDGASESPEEAKSSLEAILGDTEVILSTYVIYPDLFSLAPRLRWVQLTSAGAENIIDSDFLREGVTVTTASGIHAVPVGEFVLGIMLAFAKGLHKAVRGQMEHEWLSYLPSELQGKTAGILGMGAIGSQIARYAKAFGMRVIATRRSAERPLAGEQSGFVDVDELVPPSQLNRILSACDYLVIAVPLTAETRHMIGEAELRAMKPSAVLINISRGAVVDEKMLVRALKEGWIAGAGLDVFEQEPLPKDSELWGMENVIVTPHVSGATPLYVERLVELFCDNLRRYLAGEPLRNVVDVKRGY